MWNIETFDELPSTQTLARERLVSGTAKHGDVFVALHQSEGRGQYVWRSWSDEPGSNLLLSVVLTHVEPEITDLVQFMAGLSVLSTARSIVDKEIRSFDPARVRLKWPNDILLDGKKISGILSEAVWTGSELKGIVVGIGMNVNQEVFAQPIAARAASLKTVLKYALPLEETRDLLLATLQYVLRRYSVRDRLLADLRSELEWMKELPPARATLADGSALEGVTILGISDSGALSVRTDDGTERLLQSATITFDV